MEFQENELNEILNIFQQESAEIIASMDEKLLAIEKEKSPELAMQLFRDAHSLKGSARMLGFDDIQNIAHKIEDVISLIKEDELQVTNTVTDTISECLDFIMGLINKTVENKTEFKSDEIGQYIQKLENIVNQKQEIEEKEEDYTPLKKQLLPVLDRIEQIIIDILYIVSDARSRNVFSDIYEIEFKINKLVDIFRNIESEKIFSINNCAQNVLTALDKFKVQENKEFVFLDVNSTVSRLIEMLCALFDGEKIKKQNYYEIVDEKLNSKNEVTTINPKDIKLNEIDEIIARISLLEVSESHFDEVLLLVNKVFLSAQDDEIKEVYKNVLDLLKIYKNKEKPIPKDVSMGLVETLEAIKTNDIKLIQEVHKKSDVIKIMANFKPQNEKVKEVNLEQTQKDILNTITNSEIKTLRIDSNKLDNLVGQIGELIVSKIKTNEQLSLVKKINSDIVDWQKNFVKMNYYIKYFDKKYLSDPMRENQDYRKIVSYNKQLSALSEMHIENVSNILKEVQNLFKQLQESESQLNSTTSEIENMVKNMRILPLSIIFQLFPRMVHNIARDKNKKIDFVTKGAEVSADKTIIEEIKIPLIHIIRNAIDHGIEDAQTRRELGKNPVGRIEVEAKYKDNKVIISVKDDGRGIDIEKIKQKALEKKLLTQEEISAISDEELTNLIFYPGFSTENFVTELSGRGLGLDIVNNKINQLNGRVDVFSQLNQGTVVQITLPATVATRKVFIIQEQEQLFAIDTSVIKTIVRVNPDDIFEKDEKNFYIYNNEAIEIYTLSQILNFANKPREALKYTLMIIETENGTCGIIVEKLVSDQEIVHKKLSPPLYKIKHVSGITTLANGEACLILSSSDIISTINSRKIGMKIISKNGIIRAQEHLDKKILVVDDSHTTRILQKNILVNKGYNVSTATNPLIALEKARNNRYDLIISDIQMPHMNGFEFVVELRKIINYETIPVIIVSSEPMENHIQDMEYARVSKYIQKNSFKQEELIKTIEEILP